MIDQYLRDLGRELRAVGIRGSLRCRVLAEAVDHLSSDPDAPARFGSASEVANAFAAELGTRASRRAAAGAFGALAATGVVYAVSFTGASFASLPPPDVWPLLATLAFALLVVAPQVAFVAGSLALLRTLRRHERVLPSAELTVINRRTSVALAAGLVTIAALVVFALALRSDLSHWWVVFTLAGSAVSGALLIAAAIPTADARRFRPAVAGEAGDVFDDLGLGRARTDPWRFARRVAFGVGLAVWVAGIVQGDPIDGAIRGIAESLACLGGFAVFGRYLGLRH